MPTYRVEGSNAVVLPYLDLIPHIHGEVVLLDGVAITGDVEIGPECSFWFNAVARGDTGPIRIGRRVNIQDHAMCHATQGRSTLVIEDEVTVGHRAILHGCHIERLALIGMGAIVLDGARIGEGSLVAAGAVVLENTQIPPYSLVVGCPASVKRALNSVDTRARHELSASAYWEKALNYQGRGRVVVVGE